MKMGSSEDTELDPFECEPGGDRTHDRRIKSPLLYQLSYRPPELSSCCGSGESRFLGCGSDEALARLHISQRGAWLA